MAAADAVDTGVGAVSSDMTLVVLKSHTNRRKDREVSKAKCPFSALFLHFHLHLFSTPLRLNVNLITALRSLCTLITAEENSAISQHFILQSLYVKKVAEETSLSAIV